MESVLLVYICSYKVGLELDIFHPYSQYLRSENLLVRNFNLPRNYALFPTSSLYSLALNKIANFSNKLKTNWV